MTDLPRMHEAKSLGSGRHRRRAEKVRHIDVAQLVRCALPEMMSDRSGMDCTCTPSGSSILTDFLAYGRCDAVEMPEAPASMSKSRSEVPPDIATVHLMPGYPAARAKIACPSIKATGENPAAEEAEDNRAPDSPAP